MSVDFARDSESADYLNALRKHQAENKSGNTSAENFTPEYIIEFFNQIDISNSVTLNGNKHEFSNQLNISNSFTNTEQATGTFVVDTAKVDFSDVG